MKIAHLSDLHFTTFFSKTNLDDIEYTLRYAINTKIDHLIITGDLTDNAEPEDFDILRKLFAKYGFLHPDRMSLTIGNHDIFGGVQTAEDIFNFPSRCAGVNYRSAVKQFYDYFKETFDGSVYFSEENIFPYAKAIDDVLLIGMNSISPYSKSKNIFASNGSVDLKQFSEIAGMLDKFGNNYRNKLVMIHHHFNKMKVNSKSSPQSFWQNIEKQTMKLRKKRRLLELFNMYNIDLVMHGHHHENAEYQRKGINFMNAGGSLKNGLNNSLFINFIEIINGKISTKIQKVKPASAENIFTFDENFLKTHFGGEFKENSIFKN